MSTGLLSMLSFLMQPTKSLFLTGKSSGRLGIPPSNSGPVRSRDLQMKEKMKGREIALLFFQIQHMLLQLSFGLQF